MWAWFLLHTDEQQQIPSPTFIRTDGTYSNDVEEHGNDSCIVSVCHRKQIHCRGKKAEYKWADDALGRGIQGRSIFPFSGAIGLQCPCACGLALQPFTSPETPDSRWGKHRDWICPVMSEGARGHPMCPASETGNTEAIPLLGGDSPVIPPCSSSRRDAQEMSPHLAQSKQNVLPTTAK